jgi:hypothetical protein
MKLVEKFTYHKLTRQDNTEHGRVYVCPYGTKLPSVTTILDKTKSKETTIALENWRKFVGHKKAASITQEASTRGTFMHAILEKYIKGENPQPGSNPYHKQAFKMADVLMNTYINPFLDEAWGLETNLWFPELFAGTTDMVGVYQGTPSILDFKQTNKSKTDDRVHDYKVQLAAYIVAHDKVYNTNIQQGVILMCSVNLVPQCWIIRGEELNTYKNIWWQRIAQYYDVN